MNRRIFSAFLLLVCAAPLTFADTGTLTADGDTRKVAVTYPHIHLSGDFGGGTITFYMSDDLGNYHAISGAVFTSATDVTLDMARAVSIYGTLSGSSSPSLVWVIR